MLCAHSPAAQRLKAVVITPATQGHDAWATVGVRADFLAQVAYVHIEATVVQGQLAAQGDLRQFLLVQWLARLLEQRLEQAGVGDKVLVLTEGNGVRQILKQGDIVPIRSLIVGIVDAVDVA